MKSNKRLWAERHAAGKSKLDVAEEVVAKAVSGQMQDHRAAVEAKEGRVKVDSAKEATDRNAEAAEKASRKQSAADASKPDTKQE